MGKSTLEISRRIHELYDVIGRLEQTRETLVSLVRGMDDKSASPFLRTISSIDDDLDILDTYVDSLERYQRVRCCTGNCSDCDVDLEIVSDMEEAMRKTGNMFRYMLVK